MDLILAGWILFWDIVIVTVTVSITQYKLRKAEREALKERDEIEKKFMDNAEAIRQSIEKRIDAIEIPETDVDSIKADLKESLSQSLNAHITGIKKELNDLKGTVDKAINTIGSQDGQPRQGPDIADKLFIKMLERF